jgi:hypothetical protein
MFYRKKQQNPGNSPSIMPEDYPGNYYRNESGQFEFGNARTYRDNSMKNLTNKAFS